MTINKRSELVPEGYKSKNVPSSPMSTLDLQVFLARELRAVETAVQELLEAVPQVADSEPKYPRKGTIRYAVEPWDPLTIGGSYWVYWDGSSWQAL